VVNLDAVQHVLVSRSAGGVDRCIFNLLAQAGKQLLESIHLLFLAGQSFE